MRAALDGATTLINTYWIRVSTRPGDVRERGRELAQAHRRGPRRGRAPHRARQHRQRLASVAARVLPGKAQVEDIVASSGLAHTILRPTVIFGAEDILINNIAWFVRHFPVFVVPGDGQYGLRPIYHRRPGASDGRCG